MKVNMISSEDGAAINRRWEIYNGGRWKVRERKEGRK
jgi:hypothetical protein